MDVGGGMYQRVTRFQHCVCGAGRFEGEPACLLCGLSFEREAQFVRFADLNIKRHGGLVALCRDKHRWNQREEDMDKLLFLRERLKDIRREADKAATDHGFTDTYRKAFAEIVERIDDALAVDVETHAAERLVF